MAGGGAVEVGHNCRNHPNRAPSMTSTRSIFSNLGAGAAEPSPAPPSDCSGSGVQGAKQSTAQSLTGRWIKTRCPDNAAQRIRGNAPPPHAQATPIQQHCTAMPPPPHLQVLHDACQVCGPRLVRLWPLRGD